MFQHGLMGLTGIFLFTPWRCKVLSLLGPERYP